MAGIVDYILEEDYPRYKELLDIAEANKANAPKAERAPRAPMTIEQKLKSAQTRRNNAQAKLDALLAAEAAADNVVEGEDDSDDGMN